MVMDNTQASIDDLLGGNKEQVMKIDSLDNKWYDSQVQRSKNLKTTVDSGKAVLNTFDNLSKDVWSALYKFRPEMHLDSELKRSHRFNKQLMDTITTSTAYRDLRISTKLDPFMSTLATIKLDDELTKRLKDDLKEQADLANKLDSQDNAINDMIKKAIAFKDVADSLDSSNPKKQKFADEAKRMKAEADKAKKRANATANKLSTACQTNSAAIRSACRSAVAATVKDAENIASTVGGWGIDPGTVQSIPFDEKLQLIKVLRTDKFKKMAELTGRMRRLAIHTQKTKLKQVPDEIHSVKTGDNIQHVLPSELMLIGDPITESIFDNKLAEKNLQEFDLKSNVTEGKGPLIVCVDNSGSMAGDREIWSKAAALALLEVALMQKRNYVCIHYGGIDDPSKVIKILPDDPDKSSKTLTLATYFLSGGTDFEKPLRECLEILNTNEFKKGDIVFITDGECGITSKFEQEFLAAKTKKEFCMTTLLIQSGEAPSLVPLSDSILEISELLDSEAQEVFEL